MINIGEYIRNKWKELSGHTIYSGTVIDELAVKPLSMVMSEVQKIFDEERKSNAIRPTMTREQLDMFGSKFLVKRNEGGVASVGVTLYFNSQVEVHMNSSVRAVSVAGAEFEPAQYGSYWSHLNGSGKYSVTIPFRSIGRSSDFNVPALSISRVTGLSVQYDYVENTRSAVGGSRGESNSEYYARLHAAINSRSMVNRASVISQLPQKFPLARDIFVAGAGSPLMKRDVVRTMYEGDEIMDYRGKTVDSFIVPHKAYYQSFPPAPNTGKSPGPVAVISRYSMPQSLYNSSSDDDVGYSGIDFSGEFENDKYQGLYFDEVFNNTDISTEPLFTLASAGATIGSNHGFYSSNDGIEYGATGITISSRPGAQSRCLTYDIGQRTLVSFSGSIDSIASGDHVAILFGGKMDSGRLDAYSGYGIAIHNDGGKLRVHVLLNADPAGVHYSTKNYGFSSTGFLNSVATMGDAGYGGEDPLDISVSIGADGVVLFRVSNLEEINISGSHQLFDIDNILSQSSESYGSMFAVTASAEYGDIEITNVSVYDNVRRKCVAVMAYSSSGFSGPATIHVRASGSGVSSNGITQYGYRAYIWNPSVSEWVEADGISDPSGSKSAGGGLLKHDLRSIDDYTLSDRVYVMLITSGASSFDGLTQATLLVNYSKIDRGDRHYYKSRNKADIYLVTYRNTNTPPEETFAVSSMAPNMFRVYGPVHSLVSISDSNSGANIPLADTSIIIDDENLRGSVHESWTLTINSLSNFDDISVSMVKYPMISSIQDEYDANVTLYGDVMIKHKAPYEINIEVSYNGPLSEKIISDAVNDYVDSVSGGIIYSSGLVVHLSQLGVTSIVRIDADGVFIQSDRFFVVDDLLVERR